MLGLGFSKHDIRFASLPPSGCGEQWVRERYANEVAIYRKRAVRAATALVVALDADNGSVGRRIDQLQWALKSSEQAPRGPEERIVHLIPKWSIETWILRLSGVDVDEKTSYKRTHDDVDGQIKGAAANFVAWSRPNSMVPAHRVQSLEVAIQEIQRLF